MSNHKKTAVVTGGTGFIGTHLVNRLKDEGYWVRAIDIQPPRFEESRADEVIIYDVSKDTDFIQWDLIDLFRNPFNLKAGVDEVYSLACLMGGAGFIFTGDHDAEIMSNSAACNINTAEACHKLGVGKVFYSSSACMYPEYNQLDPNNPNCAEDSAYPADPDSEYGWEKLFSERLYLAYKRNHGMDVKIARFHNIFGPLGAWCDGKEKAPAAICRKVLQSDGTIEIWGDGNQTRSFLYIDECIEGVRRLMNSDHSGPVNIGSDQMVTINQLVDIVAGFEGKQLTYKHIDGPLGVRGRNSDNRLIKELLGWQPSGKLKDGLLKTYNWIKTQLITSKTRLM